MDQDCIGVDDIDEPRAGSSNPCLAVCYLIAWDKVLVGSVMQASIL